MSRLTLLLILTVASQAYAQSSRLIKFEAPQPASLPGYIRGHCVALPKQIRICKLLSETEDGFLVEKEGKTVGNWRAETYLGETSDFEVLRGDLDGDQKQELIVANHDATGVGLAVSAWTINIFPDAQFASFQLPLSFGVNEYGSFGTFVTEKGRVSIFTTDWVSAADPTGKRGAGLYLAGQWWRYKAGELWPIPNRGTIARRYLFSFEQERLETLNSSRIPYQWFNGARVERVTTAFLTGPNTVSKIGSVQSVAAIDEKDSPRKLKIVFKPDGEAAVEYAYADPDAQSELYLGDETSGWLYPERYLPARAEAWLTGKRASLRRYDDRRITVLWITR